jgi:hypothetical protein
LIINGLNGVVSALTAVPISGPMTPYQMLSQSSTTVQQDQTNDNNNNGNNNNKDNNNSDIPIVSTDDADQDD